MADRILVLDEGRIAEAGTHARLLEAGGLYTGMYSLQNAEASAAYPAMRQAGDGSQGTPGSLFDSGCQVAMPRQG